MRKSGLYPRLALSNLVRNRQFYLPYLLALAGTAAAFYIVTALAGTPDLPVMTRYVYLSMFMTIGTVVIALFAVIFLLYTNSFLMKRRRRELALYNILGMGKAHIARMLGMETVFAAVAGVGGGLLLGLLLQKLVTLLLCRIMGSDACFGFYVSWSGIRMTAALFCAILLASLLLNLLRIGRRSPMELLREGSAGEREPKTNLPAAIGGALCLAGGYAVALFARTASSAFLLYFPAVLLVILGTYALFSAVSIAVLRALRKNKRFYYQTRHFIGLSGMLYRMRRNAVGLANICILSTMVLVMVSGTLSLYLSSRRTLETQFPGNTAVRLQYSPEKEPPFDSAALERGLQNALGGQGLSAEPVSACRYLSVTAARTDGGFTLRLKPDGSCVDLCLMTAADYAAVTGQKPETLAPLTLRFPAAGSDDGTQTKVTVHAAEQQGALPAVGSAFMRSVQPVWVTVENEAALQTLWDAQAAANRAADRYPEAMIWQAFLNTDADEDTLRALPGRLEPAMDWAQTDCGSWERFTVETKPSFMADYFSINGGFFFLGVFLGLLFIMAAVLIIYYKQISEGYEDRERYRIMQEVGLEPQMVRQSINSQVLVVFFAPLLVAAVHVAFDYRLMLQLLTLFGLHEARLTLWCTTGVFLAFAAVYALVFALTARTYARIVK